MIRKQQWLLVVGVLIGLVGVAVVGATIGSATADTTQTDPVFDHAAHQNDPPHHADRSFDHPHDAFGHNDTYHPHDTDTSHPHDTDTYHPRDAGDWDRRGPDDWDRRGADAHYPRDARGYHPDTVDRHHRGGCHR